MPKASNAQTRYRQSWMKGRYASYLLFSALHHTLVQEGILTRQEITSSTSCVPSINNLERNNAFSSSERKFQVKGEAGR